jgi:hypothetical protein
MAPARETDERTRAEVLGGLTFSHVVPDNPVAVVRAAQWFNLAAPLRLGVPFFVIHDVGLALSYPQTRQVWLRPRTASLQRASGRRLVWRSPGDAAAHESYGRLLASLARTTLAARMGLGGLSDNVMGALLAKVLEPLSQARQGQAGAAVEVPLSPAFFSAAEPADLLAPDVAAACQDVVRVLADRAGQVVMAAEQVDLETLKLMQLMGGTDTQSDPTAVLDLYRTLESPQAHDIVNFCLDLVPQVLETSRSKGAQTYAVGGYASIETKGNLDNLLPSELAHDDLLFEQRWAENELLYFGREKDTRERERVHYVLVDASAAMRGLRTVFARGLALALCKKLTLRGEKVWLRFFDSRLYDRLEITSRSLKLPHVLCFRGERGRNPTRVFEDLDMEVARLTRDEGLDVVITLITHGRLLVPEAVVDKLVQRAQVFGVFVLPSRPVEMPYARKLARRHVVGAEALEDREARAKAALGVLMGA